MEAKVLKDLKKLAFLFERGVYAEESSKYSIMGAREREGVGRKSEIMGAREREGIGRRLEFIRLLLCLSLQRNGWRLEERKHETTKISKRELDLWSS